MIAVTGRGITDPVVMTQPNDGYLQIRIDCNDHPEFWLQLRISETELLRQLAQVHRMTHGCEDKTWKPCECDTVK